MAKCNQLTPLPFKGLTCITRTSLRYVQVFAIANPSVVCLRSCALLRGSKFSAIFLRRFVP